MIPFLKSSVALCCVTACAAALSAAELPKPRKVIVKPASTEGALAMKRFNLADGLSISLTAAEPLLANPVAFDIDEHGNFYVVECFRLHKGVTDIRQHMNWLDEELASQSTGDMLAMYKRHKVRGLTDYSDRLRRLSDTDGDGVLDHATVFADGFNSPADGLAAGVLARYGKVWLTNLPHLWLLEDRDNDGVADSRQSLASGFGVRVGFLGHDLHGLRLGPDGRIYFSIGDRAASVTTLDGRKLHTPETGAIYRCELDGTGLEIFHYGLRNPQELAFDQLGTLFTGDNNSDGGDPARWVHAIEGGDSGWRIGWQFLKSAPWTTRRGPWLDERMCFPDGVAAHRIPPIANIGNGPSGLTYYPGTGFGNRYANTFLMCDFKGTPSVSGIHAIRNKPAGAHFEVEQLDKVIWNALVTDVEFGFDGNIYISDWVNGWGMTGKGRLYRLAPTDADPAARVVKKLFANGFAKLVDNRLANLMSHADMRVRMAAQFELAKRNNAEALAGVATGADNRLARLHGIWGLGQIGRRTQAINELVLPLLSDADAEIRTQAAKVLGDAKFESAHGALAKLLADRNPRAQTQAAIALSKLPGNHTAPVLAMLERSAGNDTALQHAGTLALANGTGTDILANLANHKSIAVRTAALIALRRQHSSLVAVFLSDADAHIQLEAARAIADAHIAEAMPQLARLAKRTDLAKPLMRRVLNANFRLANAAALATVAANEKQAKLARAEALNLLAAWENPSGRDRISGLWRPISGRNTAAAVTALGEKIDAILRSSQGLVRTEAIAAAARLKLNQAGPALLAIVKNESAGRARAKALRALGDIGLEQLAEAVDAAFESDDSSLLSAATRLAAKVKPAGAVGKLESVLAKGDVAEQQSALIALGDLADPAADTVLAKWLDKLLDDTVTPPLKLELLEAAAKRNGDAVKTKLEKFNESRPGPRENPFALEPYAETLEGGNAAKGRTLFFENIALSCVRCHLIGEEGGEVGPGLDDIGSRVDRTHLLESIVNPSAKIAEGYDFFLILLEDDSGYVGIITKETATELLINSPEDGLVTVKTADVKERIKGPSGMPPGMQMVITKRELRDLIEYLATRKTPPAK